MRIDVIWTPAEVEGVSLQGRSAVVIDVLRACTTITTAIDNGARAILPAGSTEEAIRIANSIGRDQVLLCGERGGVRIEGFDLGNSPGDMDAETVAGRTLVMSTTNGTRALMRVSGAATVYVAALVNVGATAKALLDAGSEPAVVCAGRGGRVSVDDALCAGLLVDALRKKGRRRGMRDGDFEIDDGAMAALALARQHSPVDESFLRRTAGGRALESIGHGGDVGLCARVDAMDEVPVFRDRQITGSRSNDAGSTGA